MAVDPSCIRIDLSRDGQLGDFTHQTYSERYLLPGETSPQQALARASAAFADTEEMAQYLYDAVSRGWFMFATPLLSNGGSKRGLPISCFLTSVEDSRESIFEHWTESGWLSSVGGGIGGHWGDLRSAGEKTSRGSSSTGVIPFVSVMDRVILAVSQGGTRRGSYAAYLDISHPEIEEFVTMRKPTGGDQNRKGTNLHNAVNITDEFMIAVRDDADFHLRSPKDQAIIKTIRARDLWRLMIETRMQTGEPYMVFIDTINRALPEAQKKLGLRVKQSNLCVAGYTPILTQRGYIPIETLRDQPVKVWNGRGWSEVTVRQTSPSAALMRVWFDDGSYIDCTPEHNFYMGDGTMRPAAALVGGDVLEDAHLPMLTLVEKGQFTTALFYTAGWATFAGFEENNRLSIHVPRAALEDQLRLLHHHSVDSVEDESGVTIRYEPKTIPSGAVPFRGTNIERRNWLLGALSAVGEWVETNKDEYWCVASTDADMIRDMRLLALEIGLTPEIRITPTTCAFMLSRANVTALQSHGFMVRQPSVVACTHPLPFRLPTYCATEPHRGKLVFAGHITGNCTEITLPTGRDHEGKMRTAVCCLSSVNAEKFDEWKDDPLFIPTLMRMLDNALAAFITDAPASLANAVYSASRERSVGLGVLGFQAYLQKHSIAMDSPQAAHKNVVIFSHLAIETERASYDLALERGEAPDMAGTGHRFAHRMAVAPNASSSILCGGTSPSIEPHRANAYLHKTLSGSFPVRNPHLVKVLADLGLDTPDVWQSIIANEGSVQQLTDLPEHVRNVFRTAPEIDQMVLVRLAADRAPFICQAQSLNLFFEHDTHAGKITEAHYNAWAYGVKSLYYLRSTTPKRAENTNTKVERLVMAHEPTAGPEGVSVANAPAPDEGCLACEG